MPDDGKTIYKTCRELTGLTQERAAELLNLSVRHLARIECGELIPSDEIVRNMGLLYQDGRYLEARHLHDSSVLASSIVPAVENVSIQTAVMRLFNATVTFADNHRNKQLIRIAEDGHIDAEERVEFNQIVEELDDIIQAALEVRLAAGKERDA